MDLFLHLIPRHAAKAAKLATYFTGVPCKNGHVALRRVISSVCITCQIEFDRKRWINEKHILGPKNLTRHHEKREDRLKARRKAWSDHVDYYKEKHREWVKRNPGVIRHLNALRKRKIKMATPKWADKEKIRSIYEDAARLTIETGVQHHVDHEVPLSGDLVCGLHVHENLRVIPWRENLQKRNKFLS